MEQIVLNDASHLKNKSVDDLWDYWDCDSIFEKPRPIHSQETWAYARKVYEAVVGKDEASTLQNKENVDGFHIPVVSKQSPGKGRGIYAGRDIEKGERI